MSTPRKSANDFLNDSYSRAENEQMQVVQNDDDSYFVFNNIGTCYYIVTVDNDSESVLECTCPHYHYRLSNLQIPCKHIITVAMFLGYQY